MNVLFFDGGPLGGHNFQTCAPAEKVFESNGCRYVKEYAWEWAEGMHVSCYRYFGPSYAGAAGSQSDKPASAGERSACK